VDEYSGIDIATETLLFFAEAGGRLPKNAKGNSVHPVMFWRWGAKGLSRSDGFRGVSWTPGAGGRVWLVLASPGAFAV